MDAAAEGTFRIRRATPEDSGVICELINELASFEKLAHESMPDRQLLAEHLGPSANPRCEALIAFDRRGQSIGFALYFQIYSTFLTDWGIHLEDLYVRESHRGRGVGRALLEAVAAEAVSRGCARLELSVLDWNTEAIRFYRRLDAVEMPEWVKMRFAGSALKKLGGRTTAGP